MTAISERFDPATVLQAPPPAATGDYINSLRDSAGLVLGSVDWLAEKLFGVSLIEQLVKPFAGDWTHLEVAAGGWERMSAAMDATAQNLAGGATDMAKVWEGTAASAAGARMVDIAELHKSQAEGCTTIAEQCRIIIEVSQAAGELLATGLSVINDILMQLLAEAMVPIIGWAAAAALAPVKATKFFMWVNKITAGIQRVVKAINLAVRIIAILQQAAEMANKAISLATRVTQADSAFLMDDTARAQFSG